MHGSIPNCEHSKRAAGAEENERLRRIVAKQALELEIKGELLKKRLSDLGEAIADETVASAIRSKPASIAPCYASGSTYLGACLITNLSQEGLGQGLAR